MTPDAQKATCLTPGHWDSAYTGFIVGFTLTALTYLTSAFGLDSGGLGVPGLVVTPIVVPLLALAILRGGCRLAALGIFLAASAPWTSFVIVLLVGGAVS